MFGDVGASGYSAFEYQFGTETKISYIIMKKVPFQGFSEVVQDLQMYLVDTAF